MFIETQEQYKKEYYRSMLQTLGSLSKLFSENSAPYLYYRVAENLFCKSFDADNLSRSDISADASLGDTGFGLKTFLRGSGSKMEKVAEFNRASIDLRELSTSQQVQEIARLRNERIETTRRIYGVRNMIYHCVTRTEGKMEVTETPMNLIDIASLAVSNANGKSINFSDGLEEYSFNISKSTLFKRFTVENVLMEIPVEIVDDPFALLEKIFSSPEAKEEISKLTVVSEETYKECVFLPLYSTRRKGEDKEVPPKSGLNQWNAGGRARSLGEVYVPIPAWIHLKFPDFFPERDTVFTLELPNKRVLNAKICQDGGKALMTNPNEALGQWLLRDILHLEEGELLTYKKLQDIGLDAIVVSKEEGVYKVDFAKIGSYDSFEEKYNS